MEGLHSWFIVSRRRSCGKRWRAKTRTIPDQKKKPTKKTTMRRVFQVFEGITILHRDSNIVKVLNLRPIHGKNLALLGSEHKRMYCTSYG